MRAAFFCSERRKTNCFSIHHLPAPIINHLNIQTIRKMLATALILIDTRSDKCTSIEFSLRPICDPIKCYNIIVFNLTGYLLELCSWHDHWICENDKTMTYSSNIMHRICLFFTWTRFHWAAAASLLEQQCGKPSVGRQSCAICLFTAEQMETSGQVNLNGSSAWVAIKV